MTAHSDATQRVILRVLGALNASLDRMTVDERERATEALSHPGDITDEGWRELMEMLDRYA